MSKSAYESLEVYQLACALAQAVWKIARGWNAFDKRTIGAQMVRAADSVGANIAEGQGRGNGADQKRFLRVARGSVYETKHWLRLAYGRELLTKGQIDELKPLLEKLPPMLNAYMRVVGRDRSSTIDNRQSTIGLTS